MPKGLDHRISTDSAVPHYPVEYDPELDLRSLTGGMSLPKPGVTTTSTNGLEKYGVRKIPGYTGYVPGVKFGIARTPFPAQLDAKKTVIKDIVNEGDGRKEFGFTAKKPLPDPKAHSELPNIHPDDHSFENCRPPTITGNPSNKHNTTFGDLRVPGTYSNRTTYRETFKGVRSECKIVGEQRMSELYATPEARKHAYERALLRIGKKRVESLMKTMSDRITAKLGNNGASAFKMRQALEVAAGSDGVISIDEFKHLLMTVVGISLEHDDLLAIYGIFDADGSGYCDLTEMMRVLLDDDYFSFYLGNNHRMERELTNVTQTDISSMAAMAERIHDIGDMAKVFFVFDQNRSGRISRAEFALGCEKMNCPLSSAAVEVYWNKCNTSGNDFIEYDEFCAMFAADYTDYLDGKKSKLQQTGNMRYGMSVHVGPAYENIQSTGCGLQQGM